MIDPKLSANDAVVIFADLQEGIVDLPMTVPAAQLLRAAQGLARLAEIFDIPTLALSIPKRAGQKSVIVREITGTRSKIRHIQRMTPDSFQNTEVAGFLAGTGRRTLVLSGVATEVAVHWRFPALPTATGCTLSRMLAGPSGKDRKRRLIGAWARRAP